MEYKCENCSVFQDGIPICECCNGTGEHGDMACECSHCEGTGMACQCGHTKFEEVE